MIYSLELLWRSKWQWQGMHACMFLACSAGDDGVRLGFVCVCVGKNDVVSQGCRREAGRMSSLCT